MKKIILPLLAIAVLTGCKEKEEDDGYTVPSTYNFENVSYSGQTDRLDMLKALTSYVKTGHTENTSLDAQTMKDMYANENNAFSDADLNSSSRNLKKKTYDVNQTEIEDLFDSIAKYSGQTGGADGQAGLITGAGRTILVDANGKEYSQLIDKGLMGSCFYYQGTSVYLSDVKIGDAVDNTIVVDGEGTDKEHHFDEAFGYFGVPTDFPTNLDGIRFWGKYCNGRDAFAGTNEIMTYFIKGRAAISNSNKADQDAAVAKIKMYWEKAAAATAIHYLNDGVAEFSDDAERCHVLTEAYAFIAALAFNAEGSITPADVTEVLNLLGENFWDVTTSDIEAARNKLATFADLESVKNEL